MKIFGLWERDKAADRRVFPESTLKYSPKKAQEIFNTISGELYTKGCVYRREYNKNGELSQALAMLDCGNGKQKQLYMDVCRRLSESGISDEKFSEILSRGHYYGYVSEYCGKPDFSVMRDISPEDFPHFLAVALKSKNGYCRQEALRYAGDYPMLLSHITAAFGDHVKQVRREAAEAFDKAMENIPRTGMSGVQRGSRGGKIYAAFEAVLSAKLAMEKVLRGEHCDSGVSRSAEKKLNDYISRELDRDVVCSCKSRYSWRRMGGVIMDKGKSQAYVLLIKQGLMSPEIVRAVIKFDKLCSPGVSCAASAYLDLPEDML